MLTLNDLQPGTHIRTNYMAVGEVYYIVSKVIVTGENEFSLVVRTPNDKGPFWLNQYTIDGNRIRKTYAWSPGSAGYGSNHGGRNGDGYDEIEIMSPPLQPSLFVL